MEVICFYNRKGGPGKTTSTVNIGGCLSKLHNKKVLIVDSDPQCNCTDFLFASTGTEPKATLETYLRDKNTDLDDIIYPITFRISEDKEPVLTNIDLIPASPHMDGIENFDIMLLKELLMSVADNYDYCLIDCTPYLSPCTLAAFCASKWIVTVAEPDVDSVGGYSLLIDTINNVKEKGYNDTLELLGIYMNKVHTVDVIGNFILDSFKKGAGDSIFKSYVRYARIMKQMRYFGIPASYYAPSSNMAKDYEKLTNEIIERIEKIRRGSK